MATHVQNATAIIGACRDEASPDPTLLLAIGRACAHARGLDPLTATNAQLGRAVVEDVSEFLRARHIRYRATALETAAREQAVAEATIDLPGVKP